MGLFDFVKEIGHKLFSKKEEAAPAIQKHIEAANPGVKDLKVEFDDGVVKIAGTAASPEALQKAVLMAGNVKGVGEVKVEGLAVENAPAQEPPVEYYIIQKGDNLSKIAKKYYGDPNKYPLIFEANREVIKDADLIFPGQKIRIPK
jgi:nucleoid-associated protein YgaU